MAKKKPRLEPLPEELWDDETRHLLERTRMRGRIFNVFRTLAHHPKLLKRWLVFGNHVLYKSSLPPREREMVILRIALLTQCEYEWGQHVIIGREAGLSEPEIDRIPQGPQATGWSLSDANLLSAVDELHGASKISDRIWERLSERYDTQQLIDLIFVVGQYNMLAMALNSCGVQLDEGIAGFEK